MSDWVLASKYIHCALLCKWSLATAVKTLWIMFVSETCSTCIAKLQGFGELGMQRPGAMADCAVHLWNHCCCAHSQRFSHPWWWKWETGFTSAINLLTHTLATCSSWLCPLCIELRLHCTQPHPSLLVELWCWSVALTALPSLFLWQVVVL